MSSIMPTPTPPTSSLPPVGRLSHYSTADIHHAIQNLRAIYGPRTLLHLPSPTKSRTKHLIHDTSVPDSGYASAEEEDEDGDGDGDEIFDLDALRSDAFERDFVVRWLTSFAARSDVWVYDAPAEEDARAALVDAAASLLASFSGEDQDEASPEEGLTRAFEFPCPGSVNAAGKITVELNDAPLSSTDHTSVGLQSWGSAIVFAERMCVAPASFGLRTDTDQTLRVLELGAGTGLLSLVAAKLLAQSTHPAHVAATDYHPSVLANLQANVTTNFPFPSSSHHTPVLVHPLDWQHPQYGEPPLDARFDVVLAADVIYHPEHARWIKGCVERLLDDAGEFWLIVPVRSTGRHEGMAGTIEAVFPAAAAVQAKKRELAIITAESINKHSGIGRADESGYRLFKIGWVTRPAINSTII
jgi:protein-lysine N-methyltransferase EEF2KMT